jgi:hypothetical protein
MTVRRLLALAVCVVAALFFTGMAPATAEDGSLLVDLPGDSTGFVDDPGAPLIDVERLAPGYVRSSTFEIRNASPYAARLDLSFFDVADEENGCMRQEIDEQGEECAADGGELSAALRASVTTESTAGAETLWEGEFADLRDGVTLAESMPADTTWSLRATLSLPWEATNDTMTDTVRFGLRLVAESQEGGRSEVAGPLATIGGAAGVGPSGTGRPAGASVLGPLAGGPRVGLPMTGSSISLWMLLLDLAVLVGGVLLVRAGRRPDVPAGRPRPHRAPAPAGGGRTRARPPARHARLRSR